MRKSIVIAGLVLALSMSLALAGKPGDQCKRETVFTETFQDGSNEGNWWHHFSVLVAGKGKNKDYVYSDVMTTFFPSAETRPMGGESEFTGDFAARNVTRISADLATIFAEGMTDYTGMSPTVVLINDSGTPEYIDDDCIVFFQSGEHMPLPDPKAGVNWTNYDFEIPSQSQTLPEPNNGDPCPGGYCEVCIPTGDPTVDTQVPCWGVFKGNLCPTLNDFDQTWRNVIGDVDQVRISWMSPEWFAIFRGWESAVDNMSIATCND